MSCYETLRRQEDFDRVFERGDWRRDAGFALGVLLRSDDQPARVGFVAGRRIGRPVHRNRARRRLREAFRGAAQGLKPGADLVVLARAGTLEMQFARLRDCLHRALAGGGLLEDARGSEGGRP